MIWEGMYKMKIKRSIIAVLIIIVTLFIVSGCNSTEKSKVDISENQSSEEISSSTFQKEESVADKKTDSKSLVVYFSWSGNTEEMAQYIADETGSDIFRIEPAVAYPEDYTECGEVAKVEKEENARPKIKELPSNLNEYDTIYVGFPIWWHTAPMIIGTFLENSDLTGVTIYPFTQSASMNDAHFSEAMDYLRGLNTKATIEDGLFAKFSDTESIDAYINKNIEN